MSAPAWHHGLERDLPAHPALLDRVSLDENPRTKVTHLGLGKQQLVEIAKALSKEVKLLILDEPTSSLNEKDSESLLNLLVELKGKGVSSILISHKLNEITRSPTASPCCATARPSPRSTAASRRSARPTSCATWWAAR
jgi:ABC-type branched-subunit amino acid transport system ATPase component